MYPLDTAANMAGIMEGVSKTSEITIAIIVGGFAIIVITALIIAAKNKAKIWIFDFRETNTPKHDIAAMVKRYRDLIDEKERNDDYLIERIRLVTSNFNHHIQNIVASKGVCNLAPELFQHTVLEALYECICNNHLATELLPKNKENYLNKIFLTIGEDYKFIFTVATTANNNCEYSKNMPSLDDIGEELMQFLLVWADSIITEIIKSRIKLSETLKKFEPDFKENALLSSMVWAMIGENDEFLANIDRHGKPKGFNL